NFKKLFLKISRKSTSVPRIRQLTDLDETLYHLHAYSIHLTLHRRVSFGKLNSNISELLILPLQSADNPSDYVFQQFGRNHHLFMDNGVYFSVINGIQKVIAFRSLPEIGMQFNIKQIIGSG